MKSVRKIIVLLFIIAIIVGLVLGIFTLLHNEKKDGTNTDSLTQTEKLAFFVNTTNPTDIVWIGNCDELTFSTVGDDKKCYWTCQDDTVELPLRIIDEVTECSLEMVERKKEQLIVINDIDGNVNLSADEYRVIFKTFSANSKCIVIYIGIKDIDILVEMGLIDRQKLERDDYSVGFRHLPSTGELRIFLGTYMTDDKRNEMSVMTSVLHIVSNFERNNFK